MFNLCSGLVCDLRPRSLAAVDMHTAHHLYEQCISGDLLLGRTVILVTHHVSLCLPNASFVIEMSEGHVAHQGTVEELQLAGHLRQVLREEGPLADAVTDSPTQAMTPVNEADMTSEGEKYLRVSRRPRGNLVEAESRAEGRVKSAAYLTYFQAAGWPSWILTILLMVAIRAITIGNQVRALYQEYTSACRFISLSYRCSLASGARPMVMIHMLQSGIDLRSWSLSLHRLLTSDRGF